MIAHIPETCASTLHRVLYSKNLLGEFIEHSSRMLGIFITSHHIMCDCVQRNDEKKHGRIGAWFCPEHLNDRKTDHRFAHFCLEKKFISTYASCSEQLD